MIANFVAFSCWVESNWKLATLVILWTMLEVLDLKQPLAMRELVSGKQRKRKRIKINLEC